MLERPAHGKKKEGEGWRRRRLRQNNYEYLLISRFILERVKAPTIRQEAVKPATNGLFTLGANYLCWDTLDAEI